MNDTLLFAKFFLYPKTIEAEVTLTNTSINVECSSNRRKYDEVISLTDVIGCHILEGNTTTSSPWYLCIFSYPFKKNLLKGLCQQRVTRSLGIVASNNREKKAIAEEWKNAILHLVTGRRLEQNEISGLVPPPVRKLMVYVNPFSGRGRAMKIYEKYVKPMFAEAQIQHELVRTEYAGHARKMAQELLVDKYDGIVLVSGDGLIHEVLNGLMDRDDWESCIKTPIGIVPGGSGNALAASVLFASEGFHPPPSCITSSIFKICRGSTVKLDIMSVQTPEKDGKSTTLYGLLGCVIGLIADIDRESEHLRFLGQGFRTTLYALLRIITLRNYRITLSYLPADTSQSNARTSSTDLNNSGDATSASKSMSKGDNDSRSISNDYLVPFKQPVPSHWRTIEDQFLQASVLNISHISEDVTLHPSLKLNDGEMRLGLIKASVSRLNLLKYWKLLENGSGLSGVDENHAELISCKAFRIEPHTRHSKIITIDGESLSFGPFQGQIHPGLARVFGTNDK